MTPALFSPTSTDTSATFHHMARAHPLHFLLSLGTRGKELQKLRKTLESERKRFLDELENEKRNTAEWRRFFPPGHFYSPLPSSEEIAGAYERGFPDSAFKDIDLNEAGQYALIEHFPAYYKEIPFPENRTEKSRFHLANESYGHFDAIMLYCMLRHHRPARIIEVGSGFSSAAMLDANDAAPDRKAELTFIDPDTSRLDPLLRPDDSNRVTVVRQRVQDVPLALFSTLRENDVLFIDSSHVSKIGSDVNHIFFEIFPSLNPGVLIHIHDVAANFEYPREWLDAGRAWNEQYLLRAFLMNNRDYRIELFTAWVFNRRHARLAGKRTMCASGGGGQIWLRKLAGSQPS